MVRILLLSRELLVDLFGVIDVVRQEGSVIRVLNYDELAKDKTLSDSAMVLVDILRSLCGEEAELWGKVVSPGHTSAYCVTCVHLAKDLPFTFSEMSPGT